LGSFCFDQLSLALSVNLEKYMLFSLLSYLSSSVLPPSVRNVMP
jgi:hypothetical protein